VSGVDYLAVNETNDSGYVVCLIPEGSRKPYRATLSGDKYYQRIGDRFHSISHAMLRTLFYPQYSPQLSITVRLGNPGNNTVRFDGIIRNDGIATAQDAIVFVEINRKMEHLDRAAGAGNKQPVARQRKDCTAVRLPLNGPLHCGDEVTFFDGLFAPPIGRVPLAERQLFGIILRIVVHMRDQTPIFFNHKFTSDEISYNETVEVRQCDNFDLHT
jgi:hypothetical protein